MDHPVDRSRAIPARRSRARRLPRIILIVLTLLVLLYAGLWSYYFALTVLGPLALLVAVPVLLPLLLIPVLWLLVHYHLPLGVTRRIAVELRAWLHAAGLSERTGRRFPHVSRFLAARLALGSATGLGLTAGLTVASAAVWVFAELLIEVATGSSIVAADRRLINLAATLRTPALDRLMLAITFLGNGQTILVLAAVAIVFAMLARRREAAVLLALSLGTSWLFFGAVKVLVGRQRPLLESARIVQGGFSFPSGHATLSAAFYGTLAFLLLRGMRRGSLKVLLAWSAASIALLVGVSRVYLGVHYASDVLAGWTAGALWVVVVVVVEHVWRPGRAASLSRRRRAAARMLALGLLLLAVPYLLYVYRTAPPPPPALAPAARVLIAADELPHAVLQRAAHWTETLAGDAAEPVSLVFVGTEGDLEKAFQAAGWSVAGMDELLDLERAMGRRPGAANPVMPAFLGEQPNIGAFSRPDGTNAAGQYQVRVWRTPFETPAGERVWLATANYDRGMALAPTTLLPTRSIAPEIDAARDYVVRNLQASGMAGKNAAFPLGPRPRGEEDGSPFVTDGRAVILWLQPGHR